MSAGSMSKAKPAAARSSARRGDAEASTSAAAIERIVSLPAHWIARVSGSGTRRDGRRGANPTLRRFDAAPRGGRTIELNWHDGCDFTAWWRESRESVLDSVYQAWAPRGHAREGAASARILGRCGRRRAVGGDVHEIP